ncbi:hypothetical protein Back11_34350 [Paenibacillus baekrokdamisoli]|uniref:Uncharacterized protein n=1 Tax=Paenibacillus baekrokdamisoli TaxID=1712516 RepID=A0A3G9IT91_9BACL|nr:S-layer homology domain-containing protein [Paenibacillus baekrokdamisoli]MBB3070970.1 hypothetical protein [Paenibacillus baekrokdamisoli]BBH22090.1 hypothetical protein Back11_34350 [Paenibacillus baekrokdamisoli]
MKRYSSLLASLVVLSSIIAGTVASSDNSHAEPLTITTGSFTDVKANHWAKSSIAQAVKEGYVSGYPDGTFKPDANVSRAEFIKMVVTALHLPVGEYTTGSWYTVYAAAAAEAKLTVTSDFKDTNWDAFINRKQMSRIAVRGIGDSTTDDLRWMYLATKKGLITGLGDGRLGEGETTTRAQAVTIINRIFAVKSGAKLPVDKYAVGNAEIMWHGTNIFTVMPEILVTAANQYQGKTIEELWRKDKMIINSKNNKYRWQLDALIAIDLEDPKDPNRKLLPDINTLKWFNNDPNRHDLMISKWKQSYVLYSKTHVVYNKDTKMFSQLSYIPFMVSGMDPPDEDAYYKGISLNKQAHIYMKQVGDLPAMIIPKKGWIQYGKISFTIYIPAYSNAGYVSNQLLSVDGPKYKPDIPY